MPYSTTMKIYRTSIYVRSVKKLFSDEQLDEIDAIITTNPEIGLVIPGTGGLRKMRVAASGRGKRGGARVIYYYWKEGQASYLFDAYAKNDRNDLSESGKKELTKIIVLIKRGGYDA